MTETSQRQLSARGMESYGGAETLTEFAGYSLVGCKISRAMVEAGVLALEQNSETFDAHSLVVLVYSAMAQQQSFCNHHPNQNDRLEALE